MGKKQCSVCKILKDLTDFHKRKNRKSTVRSQCKECCVIYKVKYRQDYKHGIYTYQVKYTQKNRKRIREAKAKYFKENPEIFLKSNKRILTKLGKLFNKSSKKCGYALLSWSKTVKKRDNYECQNCGSKENVEAHHILHKSKYPLLSLNINNGITLCKNPCHYEAHEKLT